MTRTWGEGIGYLADDPVCRRPSVVIDEEGGGVLCWQCAAAK